VTYLIVSKKESVRCTPRTHHDALPGEPANFPWSHLKHAVNWPEPVEEEEEEEEE
jgi:hypothetical protein